MARTVDDFDTNKNAVIIHYQSLTGIPMDGERPRGCVCKYFDWFITASIFFRGFRVHKHGINKIFVFNDLRSAKRFIISEYNKNNIFNFK